MKLQYDSKADAAYIKFNDADVADSEEIRPGVVVDYDADARVIGIEILHLSKARPDIDVSEFELESA
jgi:uncharacterized protein YuzE